MDGKSTIALTCCIIALALASTAQTETIENVKSQWNHLICVVLRILQYLAAGIAVLVIMVAGLKYMVSEDFDERNKAKKMIVQAFVGIVIIFTAVNVVNYLVTGTSVEKFDMNACDMMITGSTTTTVSGGTTVPLTTGYGTTTPATTGGVTTTSTTTSTAGAPPTTDKCDLNKVQTDKCDIADEWKHEGMCDKIKSSGLTRELCCECLNKCC
ncbi:MAG: TrbC/VirB2 family protein [Candidatus Altiarchaeota archaeon]|nr:TrbC/VirB2 family protein [Candidatus Altiarchaeota archaeon]